MNNSIVSEIKNKSQNKIVSIFDKIPAIIASVFSVIFALSIVFELNNLVDGYVLVFLIVFVVLFLTMNEIIKVRMIKKVFNSIKSAIIPFTITFMLSIGLSGIGIWFWTNKTDEITEQTNVDKVSEISLIKKDYNEKTFNLKKLVFEDTKEYLDLNNQLEFLKSRGTASIDERNMVRDNIYKLQESIQDQRIYFNDQKQLEVEQIFELMNNEIEVANVLYQTDVNKMDRNNFVSYIFLTLILITEFAIIVLNKIVSEKEQLFNTIVNSNQAQKFLIKRNIIESIYLTNKKGKKISINNVKYSPANVNNVLEWEDITAMYNNLIALGILYEGHENKVNDNEIALNKTEALEIFDNYYETFLKLKLS